MGDRVTRGQRGAVGQASGGPGGATGRRACLGPGRIRWTELRLCGAAIPPLDPEERVAPRNAGVKVCPRQDISACGVSGLVAARGNVGYRSGALVGPRNRDGSC
ncbi:hypothetical protein NDU88_005662 [Pleurodeles waltl]|uniref:Uncharacterized protein n=1 Tax=Pleurodeles waltl TaxID=8319 RepID=A0AAV7MA04_PLEWA|nr:hypothetical protein NDU88_005662 [Pleurodeles waltl]